MKNKVHCEVAASKLEEADNKVHREVAARKLEEENDVHNEAKHTNTQGFTLTASPKTMKIVFLNEGRRGPEHELYRAKSGSFLTQRFGIADLEHGVSVQDDKLEVCFKFFY
ncbi:hypothetical protein MRX96_047278 [Rhipicephalus microplus]